jgi:hypothetical protein
MDRTEIEPAIKIVLTEIYSKQKDDARIEKPPRFEGWLGTSPRP